MKDDRIYIDHILECIADIEEYTVSGKDHVFGQRVFYDATLRKLQIMAESTQRLSHFLKAQVTEIDWAQIAGFRNILVHEYLGDLDSDKLWVIVEKRIPELKAALQRYQKEQP